MTKITLKALKLRNFKGVKNFEMVIDGQNVEVFGDNATGKTTIFDGCNWLLFDKDSQNKKDFSLKTLDASGKEIHGLEHEVEATFLYNQTEMSFKKVMTEKWTKKRGSVTQEFTGHETKYFIDGVPSKKKEFTDAVARIIDENIFKLLTSPSYFNEQLHWQDRRKTLLEICGDITNEDVINANSQLEKLAEVLGKHTIENHRKVIASKRKEINDELDKIPVRIDELERNIPDLAGVDKAEIEFKIDAVNTLIDNKQNEIYSIKNGNAVIDKKKQIQEIELELLKIKQEHQSDSGMKMNQLKVRIQEEESNGGLLLSKKDRLSNQKDDCQATIKELQNTVQLYRNKWSEVNAEEFLHETDCACPTCGQALPEDQVQATKDRALSLFNQKKSEQLENIISTGKELNEKIEIQQKIIEKIDTDIFKIQEQVAEKRGLITKLKNELSTLNEQAVDINTIPEYNEKSLLKLKLGDEILQLELQVEESIQTVKTEIERLNGERNLLQNELGRFASADQAKKRIRELKDRERELAKEFESLEEQLYLTEEFIRCKVTMLEEKINGKFKYARFKMFSEQINGGLQEVCETLFEGVPYSSGLNNAAKINVGLDIINTLSKHHGFSAPIFIDNAEAVTRFNETEAQTISLVVSEADKALRVVLKGDK